MNCLACFGNTWVSLKPCFSIQSILGLLTITQCFPQRADAWVFPLPFLSGFPLFWALKCLTFLDVIIFVWLPPPLPAFLSAFTDLCSMLPVPQCLQPAACVSVSAECCLCLSVRSMLPVPVSAVCCLCLSVCSMLLVPQCPQHAACASVSAAT